MTSPTLKLIVNHKPVMRLDPAARVDVFLWCLLGAKDAETCLALYRQFRTALKRADLKPVA